MRRNQGIRLVLAVISFIISILSKGIDVINKIIDVEILDLISKWLFIGSICMMTMVIVQFMLSNKIHKGLKYSYHYWKIKNKLEKQMIDANYAIRRRFFMELPKIYLTFNNELSAGILKIKNSIKYDKKLDNMVLSAGLSKFLIERNYKTDDANFYIYELIDASIEFKQIFDTFNDFLNYSKSIDDYKLFLDNRTNVKLQHSLLVGMTGSGKTYALYSLILQMLNKQIPYQVYFADPKGSSLAVIGSEIAEEKTVVDVFEIIDKLDEFVSLMRARKAELKTLLKDKIDGDYSDFNLEPYVFICDEYASFSAVIAGEDKKTRDKVKALLAEIILQGRQLGFFLFLVMQKSDASLIDTTLRDNVPLKIVLGNSEQQTYVTAFGAGVPIPNRHYLVGEGVFTEPVLAPEPKLVQFPYCKFDILQAIRRTPVV